MATPQKRKHIGHSVESKMRLLLKVDSKQQAKKEICKENGIAPLTLSGFIDQRKKIKEAFEKQEFGPE